MMDKHDDFICDRADRDEERRRDRVEYARHIREWGRIKEPEKEEELDPSKDS